MRVKNLIACLLVMVLAATTTGCSIPFSALNVTGNEQTEEDFYLNDVGTDNSYDIPEVVPNVLVDQVGYRTESTKVAIFRGKEMGDTFDVIDADSGETVYTGKIEDYAYNDSSEENNAYGTFTEVETKGTYYIQTAIIGQSYPFNIGDEVYTNTFLQSSKNCYYNRCGSELPSEYAGDKAHAKCHMKVAELVENDTEDTEDAVKEADTEELEGFDASGGWHTDENYNKSVEAGCLVAENLLLSYEIYPEVFTEDVGIPESGNEIPDLVEEVRYEIDWLLKMQDIKTGGVYQAVETADNLEEGTIPSKDAREFQVMPVTLEATADFAAILAKFSQVYKIYDLEYANQCLAASEKAYRYLETSSAEGARGERFFAAAELYKATGTNKYNAAVKSYLQALTDESQSIYSSVEFYGCIAYLTTKKKVDIEICNAVIKKLMEDAEDIAINTHQNAYLIYGDNVGNEVDYSEVFDSMMKLTIVDYVLSGHEYSTIIESTVHYLLGRNPYGLSLIDGCGSAISKDHLLNKQENSIQLYSAFTFIMSGIMSKEIESEEEVQ